MFDVGCSYSFVWFAVFDAKKIRLSFIPGSLDGALVQLSFRYSRFHLDFAIRKRNTLDVAGKVVSKRLLRYVKCWV